MKKAGLFAVLISMLIGSPAVVLADEAAFSDTDYESEMQAQTEKIVKEFVTTANLNFRQSPSTESGIIETVPRGRTVTVTDLFDGEWYQVSYNGNNGYMSAEYLAEKSEAAVVQVSKSGNVELLEWEEAKKIFTLNKPMQVIDVRTGITYQVASFSNGNHADVEPVTADDTAAMLRTYNGKWSWDTRPIWVIINGRTLAASINGMPHGGGVNNNNNMNGQICIHFRGSRTHNGNKSHERDHQNSITEAFNAGA